MAAPVVESGWTLFTSASAGTITLEMPTSLATDELCLMFFFNDSGSSTPAWDVTTNFPTGFTMINHAGSSTSDCHSGAFYRVITGGESWPISSPCNSTRSCKGYAVRVTGASTTTPLNQTGADVVTSTGTTIAITGVTTDVDDCLAFWTQAWDTTDTPFTNSGTGWVDGDEDAEFGGNTLSGNWGHRTIATAGASNTLTVTSSSSNGHAGFQFAIAPAAAAGGVLGGIAGEGGIAGHGGIAGKHGGIAG